MAANPRIARGYPETVTVVVKNLPLGTTDTQLRALCHGLAGVVEVNIPNRTVYCTKFIFGFVRFASLETAMRGVEKLGSLVMQRRQLTAELGRSHWRNTNHKTVMEESSGSGVGDVAVVEEDLTVEEINSTVMQLCQRQWYQHRRRHHHKDLPPFSSLMELLCRLPDSVDEGEEGSAVGGLADSHQDMDPFS